MAIQRGIIKLSGKIGDLVFFQKDGQGMVKAAADKKTYQLSEGSKKTSLEFRTANATATLFRHAFKLVIDNTADKKFIHRVKSNIIKIINTGPVEMKGERQVTDGDVALLKEMEFNVHAPLGNLITFSPVIDVDPFNNLQVAIPKLLPSKNFKAPAHARKAIIQFSCCSFDYAAGNGRFAHADDLVISLTDKPFPGGSLNIPLEYTDDRLLVLVMGVRFESKSGNTIRNRKWYAGKVVESVFIKDGKIVTFQYPEPVEAISDHVDDEDKRVGWVLNG